jgi:hypothetical protein
MGEAQVAAMSRHIEVLKAEKATLLVELQRQKEIQLQHQQVPLLVQCTSAARPTAKSAISVLWTRASALHTCICSAALKSSIADMELTAQRLYESCRQHLPVAFTAASSSAPCRPSS